METQIKYEVRDSRENGRIIRTCSTMKSAYRLADKLDAEYGAVRYIVARKA